jgi:hypothetical protein
MERYDDCIRLGSVVPELKSGEFGAITRDDSKRAQCRKANQLPAVRQNKRDYLLAESHLY